MIYSGTENGTKQAPVLNEQQLQVQQLLFNQRTVTETGARLLRVENISWEVSQSGANYTKLAETEIQIQKLLTSYPATMGYFANL